MVRLKFVKILKNHIFILINLSYTLKKYYILKKIIFLMGIIGWFLMLPTLAQKPITSQKFFSIDSIVDITITTDLNAIIRKKAGDDSLEARISSPSLDGIAINEKVSLLMRGNNRRDVCKIPPMRINFIKTKNSELHKLKSLKIVNPCEDNIAYEEILIKEYLIYKMYNAISDLSLKVRLARITYKDSLDKRKPIVRYSFFIEDIDVLAKRNDAKELVNTKVVSGVLNREQLNSVSLFQFMIANTDWGISNNGHNIKFIRTKSQKEPVNYLIPYDFDHAGLVNAPYAAPSANLGIEDVTTRYFFSIGQTVDELLEAFEPMKAQKENFMNMIKNCDLLSQYAKKDMSGYLEIFYDIMSNQSDRNYYFIKKNRSEPIP